MSKYIVLLLLLGLWGCSGKLLEPLEKPIIKATGYKMVFTNYNWLDTLRENVTVKRVTNRDTVTYIYVKEQGKLSDTLKIYGSDVLLNREKINSKSNKQFFYNGKKITIHKFHYMDDRRLLTSCPPVHTFFINDSLGIFLKKVSTLNSYTFTSDIDPELQKLVIKDSVFFRSY